MLIDIRRVSLPRKQGALRCAFAAATETGLLTESRFCC